MKKIASVIKKMEVEGEVVEAELQWVNADAVFSIMLIGDGIQVLLIPLALDSLYVYRQYMLLAALPIVTETLASDAMAIVFAQSLNAEITNPEVDPNAVRQAVGSEEFDRILALPLPEDIAAQLS